VFICCTQYFSCCCFYQFFDETVFFVKNAVDATLWRRAKAFVLVFIAFLGVAMGHALVGTLNESYANISLDPSVYTC